MAKSARKSARGRSQGPVSAAKPAARGIESPSGDTAKPKKPDSSTKQSRVLSMLRTPAGATIAAMMQATGWQQHSVRGFLAGVVRKRLKLKLTSKKVEGARVYQITDGGNAKARSRQPKRPAA